MKKLQIEIFFKQQYAKLQTDMVTTYEYTRMKTYKSLQW